MGQLYCPSHKPSKTVHSLPASQGWIGGYRIGEDQSLLGPSRRAPNSKMPFVASRCRWTPKGPIPDGQARIAAFRQGLQQLGWTEDRNIRLDLRWGGGDVERIRAEGLAHVWALFPNTNYRTSVVYVASPVRIDK